MKKVLAAIFVGVLTFSMILTPHDAFASTSETTEFTYYYNGVKFVSDKELTEEMIQDLYNQAVSPSASSITSKSLSNTIDEPGYVIPNEGGSRMLTDKIYRTYDNTDVEIAAGIIAALLLKKAPAKFSQSRYEAFITVPMTAWLLSFNDTYVGSWQTESYNSYNRLYEQKNTIVHYRYGNYTSPMEVQYYSVGFTSKPTP
ncbi:hypothetical protein [Bacillus suaedaesalsae]|uniref:Uncharacterized protein n=1 Tax=Bacillus suaedaesalsae TaxID=2810349 RepID=A0ABS2DFZ8_9BACI|nr:hypothetical protein [Bacillus suaedaesalsae]MBM6616950.1 hypothetical protein [Bacillus suaedaesalsae]